MPLKFSLEAQFDLENISYYGHLKYGEKRAELYLKGLEETLNIIMSFPEIGKVPFPDDEPSTRYIKSGVHMIYYEVSETDIFVNAIIHSRANTYEILASRRHK